MTLLKQLLEYVTQDQQNAYEQWKRDCKQQDLDCMFSGSIGLGAQGVNWVVPGNKIIGDWDGKTMTGVVYDNQPKSTTESTVSVVDCIEDYINDNFYVYDRQSYGPGADSIQYTVEEAKSQYEIYANQKVVNVRPIYDTGATKSRSKEIQTELKQLYPNK